MKTFLATLAALTASGVVWSWHRAAARADAESARDALPHALPHRAAYMVRDVPRQFRAVGDPLDVDAAIAHLQPCGVSPVGTCRLHSHLCGPDAPCCESCPAIEKD